MNLLVDPAPTVYTLGDKEYPLNTSFRFGILFEQMMLDDALSNREKGLAALELFFPGMLPTGENEAGSAILWFYNCGKPWKRGSTARMRRAGKVFDYDQDDGYIFAAFLEQYGVVKCEKARAAALDGAHILGRRDSKFDAELLVDNRPEVARLYPGILTEQATIDDIMTFFAKGAYDA